MNIYDKLTLKHRRNVLTDGILTSFEDFPYVKKKKIGYFSIGYLSVSRLWRHNLGFNPRRRLQIESKTPMELMIHLILWQLHSGLPEGGVSSAKLEIHIGQMNHSPHLHVGLYGIL